MTWTWLGILAGVILACSCLMGYKRGFIKEVVSMLFLLLSLGLVWIVNPYVNEFVRENTPVYEIVQENCRNLVESQMGDVKNPGGEEQKGLIESMDLPEFLQISLEDNNRADVYRYLAVNTFEEYLAGYLARVVTNGLSFLVSFLLVTILIKIAVFALNILASLPIIRGANKIAGALLGAAKGVIFIWIIQLIFTVLCNTEIGKAGLGMVEQDTFLSTLYENNVFMQLFMSILVN